MSRVAGTSSSPLIYKYNSIILTCKLNTHLTALMELILLVLRIDNSITITQWQITRDIRDMLDFQPALCLAASLAAANRQ